MWMCYLQIIISLAPHHTNVCKFSQPCRAIIIFSRYRCITFKFGNFQMLRRSFQYCQRTYPNLSMSKDEKTVKRSHNISVCFWQPCNLRLKWFFVYIIKTYQVTVGFLQVLKHFVASDILRGKDGECTQSLTCRLKRSEQNESTVQGT